MRGRRRDAQVRVVGVGALRRIPLHRPRRRHPHRTGPSKRAPAVEPRNGPSAEWTPCVRTCVRACVCLRSLCGPHRDAADCWGPLRAREVCLQGRQLEEDEIRHCMCAGGRAGGRAGVLVQDGRFEEDEGLMQELAAMDAMQADTAI